MFTFKDKNDDGFLSSSKKLQDNNFYQDFSYQIKVMKDFAVWKDVIKTAIHPAGLKVFGQYYSEDQFDLNETLSENTLVLSTSSG